MFLSVFACLQSRNDVPSLDPEGQLPPVEGVAVRVRIRVSVKVRVRVCVSVCVIVSVHARA